MLRTGILLVAATVALALTTAVGVALPAGQAHSGSQGVAAMPVPVAMDEWSITPRHLVVKANHPVRFDITNTGALAHRFVVTGFEKVWDSGGTEPGQTMEWAASFDTPGTYRIWCSLEGGAHKQQGMIGTLTVVDEEEDPVLVTPVRMREFAFEPMSITAVAGQHTRFVLENLGELSHVLHIEGHGVDARSPTVRVGQTVEWDMEFDAFGTYEIYCSFRLDGVLHREFGQVGTLQVFRGGSRL